MVNILARDIEAFKSLEEIPPIIFKYTCPNCGGAISSKRLALGVPCEKCFPLPLNKILEAKEKMERLDFLRFVWENTDKTRGKNFEKILNLELELQKINELSLKISGNRLWSSQRTWSKRLIKGISFSITAPTGLGKTYFGILASIYYAMNGRKVLFIVPTAALVTHVLKRFSDALSKLKMKKKIVVIGYHSKMRTATKKNFENRIKNRKFSIAIITARFLSRNFNRLKKYVFDLIFVDDVDALLKSSENIDRVLYLVGFKKNHIKRALKLVKKKQNFMYMRTPTRKRLLMETMEFKKEIQEYKKNNKVGQIIISSATGVARGLRVKILRELLDFTIGSARGGLRNVVDSYYVPEKNEKDTILGIIKKLGGGGIIFVYKIKPRLVDSLIKKLSEAGFRVGDATKQVNIDKLIEDFSEGKIDILIGAASYYGKLARGLDIPQMIRYAVFVGVPHFKFPLEVTKESHPLKGYILLNEVVEFVEDKKLQMDILRMISNFRRKFLKLKSTTRQAIIESIRTGKKLGSKAKENIKQLCINILETAQKLLSDEKIIKKLKESPFVDVRNWKGKLYIHIPDAKTYIQGSGRTSRLYAGGITKGLAVIVTHHRKLLDALIRRSKIYIEDIEWKDFRDLDTEKIVKEIDDDRKKLKNILEGKIPPEFKELVKTTLVIVESPTKAKTIARFFGRPAKRLINGFLVYEVTTGDRIIDIMATRGHTYDLELADIDVSDFASMKNFFDVSNYIYGVKIIRKNGYTEYIPEYNVLGICRTCGKRFTGPYKKCPRCGSTDVILQSDIIDVVRQVADEVDEVLIATDPDAEGEKIGFDLALTIMPYANKVGRIEYHAVTLSEFKRALETPRPIDLNRVKAQLVRRIVDRWVGFAFSHLLWRSKHIKKKFFSYSAGRVQTPVLGWIIDRFNEYKKNKTNVYFMTLSNGYIVGLDENGIPKETWLGLKDKKVKVKKEVGEEEVINPLPPYTTAEFLRDISAQLKFSAVLAMRILQELFESGLITYHRTDSTRVSPEGIGVAREYIKNSFGGLELFQPRTWTKKGEEGAHECIRPTMPIHAQTLIRMLQTGELVLPIRFTKRHFAVYNQIFRRFIASQMPPAKIRRGKITLIFNKKIKHTIEGIVEVVDPGFMRIYPLNTLPNFDNAIVTDVRKARISKVTLFTESEIIDKMRSEEIGRPSTYALIIDILFKRGYIKASPFKNKIFPLKRGITIYSMLTSKVKEYSRKLKKIDTSMAETLRKFITVDGTRELEREMDLIERGIEDYQKILEKVHKTLKAIFVDLIKYYNEQLLPAIEAQINERDQKRDIEKSDRSS